MGLSIPSAPVPLLSSLLGDRDPSLGCGREEPGGNRLFSLNGIDYFCNQHLVAKTEHPLLQDSKTKITQGREKDIIQKLSCSQTMCVGSVPSRGSKPTKSTHKHPQPGIHPVPEGGVAPACQGGTPKRGCCLSPRRRRPTGPAGCYPMGHASGEPRRSLAALGGRQHPIPHPCPARRGSEGSHGPTPPRAGSRRS